MKLSGLKWISFCTNFQEDWRKTCPDIWSLLFVSNKELHKKFPLISIVCQRWSHSKKRKTGITFNLDVILTCGFFFKVIFFEGMSVEEIKLNGFSEVYYCFNADTCLNLR